MKPFAQQHLDDLIHAHADFMEALAPFEEEHWSAYYAFLDSWEDPDDIDWGHSRLIAIQRRHLAKTAVARETYYERIAASEAEYRKNRIAVMGR